MSAPAEPHDRDPLTGLPGRAGFHAALAAEIARPEAHVGVIVVDLDGLRGVNSSLGYRVGDRFLKSIARRLVEAFALEGTVARIDGDEFGVIVPGADASTLRHFGQQCCRIVRQPDPAVGAAITLTASVGSALAPTDATSAVELVHRAQLAQFGAKVAGRDRALAAKPAQGKQIEARVRACIAEGNFSLNYQPIVTLTEPPRLVGVEGLLRWRHPTRGPIVPADFRPVLEEPAIARIIGSAVLIDAITQLRAWADARVDVGRLSLNISTVQLCEGDLAGEILGLLAAHRVPPERLTLEIPEDVYLLADLAPVRATLQRLRDAGVGVAVDGWAQGEFSFEELLRLPIQELKLDRALVQNAAAEDRLAHSIARARALGIGIVAEGVETGLQRQRLADLGCERAQGWLIGRPMSAGKIAAFAARLASGEAGARLAA